MVKGNARLLISLLFLLVALLPLQASAAGKDCPFIGTLESFQAAEDPKFITYETRDFKDQGQTIYKTGTVCQQIYRLKPGQSN